MYSIVGLDRILIQGCVKGIIAASECKQILIVAVFEMVSMTVLYVQYVWESSSNFNMHLSTLPSPSAAHTHTHTHTTHTRIQTHAHTHTHTHHTHTTHTQCGLTALDLALQKGDDDLVMTLLDNANQ